MFVCVNNKTGVSHVLTGVRSVTVTAVVHFAVSVSLCLSLCHLGTPLLPIHVFIAASLYPLQRRI